MLKHTRWLTALILLIQLLPATWALAQTAEPSATAEAEDARAVLLGAMHGILADSFHYTSKSVITSTYTGSDKKAQTVVNVTTADGDVAPKGDNDMLLTSAGGASLDAVRNGPHAEFERIVADGVVYINVSDALKKAVPQIEVDAGWYRLDDLLAKLGATPIKAGIENLSNIAMPTKLVVNDKFVLEVTEIEAETVDGVEARVFDVRLDALGLAAAQMPGSATDKLAEMVKNRALYAASTFTYTARVWVNRDSGKLLKMHVDGHTALPYLTVSQSKGISTGLSYDVDIVVSSDVTLTHYGEPVEIQAPTTVP